ncbi:hypothetical protein [Planctomicrobium sp. SH664]|uniref:hypothetical protein n=1 Tax=Planctomicrobium sp. SH664 TaxID=3448125 RepID=UPI003F5C89BE
MGAKIGSFLATLMLSVPLSAAALMAIFGVPPLSQVIASTERSKLFRGSREADSWHDLRSLDKNMEQTAIVDDAPAFGAPATARSTPIPRDDRGTSLGSSQYSHALTDSPSARTEPAFQQQASAGSYPAWAQAPAAGTPEYHLNGEPPRSDAPPHDRFALAPSAKTGFAQDIPLSPNSLRPSHEPVSQLTWRQASLRLAELGIEKYHVEAGSTEGQFLFVCVYTPHDAPHVTHRFEAEAEDPLQAVSKVLNQVDQWLRQRFGASNFPPPSGNSSFAENRFR